MKTTKVKQESLYILGLLCQAQLLRVPSAKEVKLVKPAGIPWEEMPLTKSNDEYPVW